MYANISIEHYIQNRNLKLIDVFRFYNAVNLGPSVPHYTYELSDEALSFSKANLKQEAVKTGIRLITDEIEKQLISYDSSLINPYSFLLLIFYEERHLEDRLIFNLTPEIIWIESV